MGAHKVSVSRHFAHSVPEGAQHSTGVLGAEAAARSHDFQTPSYSSHSNSEINPARISTHRYVFRNLSTQHTPGPQTARLKFFLPSWERITQDPWVLEVIQGYKIELVTPPVQQSLPPVAKLSLTQEAVLEQEVNKLLVKQAIHSIHPSNQEGGFISSMFVVPKKDGGSRPVVNLKLLNQYLAYEHFKMEGIRTLGIC